MDVFLTGFPKKLLVATTVLVIIAIYVMPTEARNIETKLRHEGRDLVHTKEHPRNIEHTPDHKKRPHRKHLNAKESSAIRLQRGETFRNATIKIKSKLKNTWRHFNKDRSVLNETREYSDGMTSWLPSISFVDIHFHNYKTSRRTISERKFMFQMPKLYKSLMEFNEVFERLLITEVDYADLAFHNYKQTRQELMNSVLYRLNSTIAEISDNMEVVGVSPPRLSPSGKIDSLKLHVDATQCLKNDYIAFRAYGNLLNNWYSEFQCPKGKKVTRQKPRCKAYVDRLLQKKNNRSQKFS